MENKEEYLGDGLYASFDGYQFILRAPRGDGVDHRVGLEPSVFKALLEFRKKVYARYGVPVPS